MHDGNVTLIGYNSKKQPYVYFIVGILVIITAIFCFFFAEGNKKYASIGLIIIGMLFIIAFLSLLKQPKIALKVIDDKYIFFYSSGEEKVINVLEIEQVHYWPAQAGLKITFVTGDRKEHFTYLLENIGEVKKYLLGIFERNGVEIVKRYDT